MNETLFIYRATGVVLIDLVPDTRIQYSLFKDTLKAEKIRELYEAVDAISGKYGKHTLHLGGSHFFELLGKGCRGEPTAREQTLFFGETRRKHLGIPSSRRRAREMRSRSMTKIPSVEFDGERIPCGKPRGMRAKTTGVDPLKDRRFR